eukprot:CAMPEP_0176408522 /NCGR_PEP_ID=MMETSP0127-20121128/1998_1 /TAXON_ID=938130 /ORGANISM="Platyophrya macrostoma, Strain WH" /LENGTH=129 /DNA_ID=CAMNT_0017787817 /DNA_START=76 /DNA_END=465 /DNA_ORIENTATION=+
MSSGIPMKILLDAVGTHVYLELETGETYEGRLVNVEDSLNVLLEDATKKTKVGHPSHLERVYVRGSNIVFFQLPDALKTSPQVQAALAIPNSKSDARGFGGGRLAAGVKSKQQGKRARNEASTNDANES